MTEVMEIMTSQASPLTKWQSANSSWQVMAVHTKPVDGAPKRLVARKDRG